jgi:CheY-like chemotaxis protein
MKLPLDMLFVDDEASDAQLFGRAVRKSGLDIRLKVLTSGAQAIDYLQAKGSYADRSLHPFPDVIVLDLKMPGLNGFDFLAWRKVSALFQSIPVVIFSALGSESDVKRVFELGANKHLLKPEVSKDWSRVVLEIYDFAAEGSAFEAQDAQL